jgi:S1-C subfamily serine protease
VPVTLALGACSSTTTKATAKSSTNVTTTIATAVSAGAASDAAPGAALQNTFVSVLARVRPSVVEIATSDGLGSGVVYDGKGNIVTHAHVGTASSLQVSLSDGRTLDATLVGVYAPDDLAVVKVADGVSPRPRSPTPRRCRWGTSRWRSATPSAWPAR